MIFVFEGMDSSGKSYVINYLTQQLRQQNIKVMPVANKVLANGESDIHQAFNILNLNLGDIKHLIYLASHINAWEDILKFEKENPDGIVLKDRGFITVLTYLSADPFINLSGVSNLVKEYIKIYPRPDATFCLMPKFSIDRVKHRTNLTNYYNNFNHELIEKEFYKNIDEYKNHQNISIFKEDGILNFEVRNKIILNNILQLHEEKFNDQE